MRRPHASSLLRTSANKLQEDLKQKPRLCHLPRPPSLSGCFLQPQSPQCRCCIAAGGCCVPAGVAAALSPIAEHPAGPAHPSPCPGGPAGTLPGPQAAAAPCARLHMNALRAPGWSQPSLSLLKHRHAATRHQPTLPLLLGLFGFPSRAVLEGCEPDTPSPHTSPQRPSHRLQHTGGSAARAPSCHGASGAGSRLRPDPSSSCAGKGPRSPRNACASQAGPGPSPGSCRRCGARISHTLLAAGEPLQPCCLLGREGAEQPTLPHTTKPPRCQGLRLLAPGTAAPLGTLGAWGAPALS